MATYVITFSNWNSAAFWSGIVESGGGHTLDFSPLGSAFSVNFDEAVGQITITNGATVFVVGQAGSTGTNVNMGGSTQLSFFDTVITGSGPDTLSGGTGADMLTAGSGNDDVFGGTGNDTIFGNAGADVVYGGDGDDQLHGGNDFSSVDSLFGGAGNDFLNTQQSSHGFAYGGADADTIQVASDHLRTTIEGGETGDDRDRLVFNNFGSEQSGATIIFSGNELGTASFGTNDVDFREIEEITASIHADSINAAADGSGLFIEGRGGDDTIIGGTGDDSIFGGSSADRIDGGAGADMLAGDVGNDTLAGAAGNDTLSGGEGADSVDGGDGADVLSGDAGFDVLLGATGDDTIHGGSGGDLIYGGNDDDLLYGGTGNDTIHADEAPAVWRFGLFVAQSSGTSSLSNNGTYTFNGNVAKATVHVTDDDGAFEDNNSSFGSAIDSGAPQVLASDLTINGIFYSAGTTIHAVAQNDIVNTTTGETGNAWVIQIGPSYSDNAFLAYDIVVNTGDQITWTSSNTTGVQDRPFADATGLEYGDLVQIDGQFSTFKDTVSGDAGSDILFGGAGDDLIRGDVIDFDPLAHASNPSGPATTFTVQNDSDTTLQLYWVNQFGSLVDQGTIAPGTGVFVSTFAEPNWVLYDAATNQPLQYLGNPANGSTVTYAQGDDQLFGGAGNDTLQGDHGDDTLDGGAGDDILSGGTGSDRFVFSDGFGTDTVDGGQNYDTIDLIGLTNPVSVVFSGPGAGTITDTVTGETINFSGIEQLILTHQADLVDASLDNGYTYIQTRGGNDLIQGSAGNDVYDDEIGASDGQGNDTFFGGAGNDTLWMGTDDDLAFGGTGDDSLEGQAGDDSLYGDDGNDTLVGAGGDDVLIGGAGNDSMFGGAGADRFFLDDGFGADTITGAESDRDVDVIDASELDTAATVTFTGNEAGTLAAGGDTATFSQIEGISLGNQGDTLNASAALSSPVVAAGGAGADTMTGGAGGDLLIGDGQYTNLIQNGSFENTTGMTVTSWGYRGDDATAPGGWYAGTGGVIDVHHTGAGAASDGSNWLDMEAVATVDTISQAVQGVIAGQSYTLRFDAIDAIGDNAVNVFWNGQLIDTVAPGSAAHQTYSYEVFGGSGDGSDILTFQSLGPIDMTGVAIDNVQLLGFSAVDVAAGNDVLDGGTGDDTLIGGGGDDSLIGSFGADVLFGGAGADTAVFAGDVTEYRFDHGPAGELIVSDLVAGRDGQDTLGGFEYAIFNGVTYHLVLGDDGSNTTLQGPNDGTPSLIVAHDGNDWGGGHPTSDAIFGGAGDDTLDGGDGDDTLVGEDGDDLLRGDAGDDSLIGDTGADTLIGGAGNDRIDPGQDGMVDVIVFADGDGHDTITGLDAPVDNGDGTFTGRDRLDVAGLTDANGARVSTDDVTVTDDGAGNAVLSFPNGEALTFAGISPATADNPVWLEALGIPRPDYVISGTAGSDLIDSGYTGDPQGDMVDAGDAADGSDNDIINAGAGDDTIFAGEGADIVTGDDGDDQIYGSSGNDSLSGALGADRIFGQDGDDTLFGGIGDDVLDGDDAFSGNDQISGNEGNDEIIGDGGNDTLFGGSGNDTIYAGADDDRVFGDADDDLVFAGSGNDTVNGDDGNDTVHGEAGADSIEGGLGNDWLSGGTDNDTVSGGDGADSVYGAEGNDLLFGGAGNDSMEGWLGDDTLDGGDGDDYLDGGDGNDTLIGGDGNDILLSGSDTGADSVEGGAGNDSIVSAGGNDTLFGGDGNDTILAGDGDDTIAGGAGSDLAYGGDGNDFINTRMTFGLGSPDRGYPGVFPSDSDPNNDRDTIHGGAGNDTVLAGDDNDLIFGGDGADSLDAGFDDDTVHGDQGADTIIGGEGRDLIHGGDDDDLLYGDAFLGHSEYFELTDADGSDLRPDNSLDTVYGGAGNDAIYGGDDNDELHGGDGDDQLFGGVDNDTLLGDAGADTLFGGQGDDQLFGGDDADLLDGGAGADTLDGGGGDDAIRVGDGDMAAGGGGDDTFFVTPDTLNGGTLFIDGGESDEIAGDTLHITGPANIVYDGSNPENGTVTWLDGSVLTFQNIENITYVPCFTEATLIKTRRGEVPAAQLRLGDMVLTRNHGYQPIRWIGIRRLDAAQLRANPALNPVLIRAGALGFNTPERDLTVSPQHRMLIGGGRAQLWFGEDEVFVSAVHLDCLDGVEQTRPDTVTYVHVMFDSHQIISSDGAWSESYQPGDLTLSGMDDDQRAELFSIFPELFNGQACQTYQAARITLKKHEVPLLFV